MSVPTEPSRPVPYSDLSPAELILRDRLALDRTVLANERTLLAYIRTALALFIAGISLAHLPYLAPEAMSAARLYSIVGWLCAATSVLVVLIGAVRYRRFQVLIRGAGGEPGPR